jgi:aldose 1-epimerase
MNHTLPVLPRKVDFEHVLDGLKVSLFVLQNKNGVKVSLTNYGARIVSLITPDSHGKMSDIVLGYNTLHEYLDSEEPYFGATVGRCCNRISNARFVLDGKVIDLTANKGTDHLHGGKRGFHTVVWDVISEGEHEVTFQYLSKDGEEGYPGNLKVQVTYSLNNLNELGIRYTANTDKKTVLNLTNHAFFNLSGAGDDSVGDHVIQINADSYLPVNEFLLPTGEIKTLSDSPLDFRDGKKLKEAWNTNHEQVRLAEGVDHTFVLYREKRTNVALVASVHDMKTGRVLEVETTEPGVQLYTGNALSGVDIGREGKSYGRRSAFCLETQHFPDSPNHDNFPLITLDPLETFTSTTIYRLKW